MTPKQERFTAEYMLDFNATQAAIRAGYSPHCATVLGSRLLKRVDVSTAIQAETTEKRRKLASTPDRILLTAERVLEEIRRIAFADIGEIFDENGRLKDMRSIPRETRAAIASIKVLKTNMVSGDGIREQVVEVKLNDKLKALELAAKHLMLLTEKVEHSGEITVRWQMAEAQEVIDVTPRKLVERAETHTDDTP